MHAVCLGILGTNSKNNIIASRAYSTNFIHFSLILRNYTEKKTKKNVILTNSVQQNHFHFCHFMEISKKKIASLLKKSCNCS